MVFFIMDRFIFVIIKNTLVVWAFEERSYDKCNIAAT